MGLSCHLGVPSCRAPWGEAPSPPDLTFRLVQCKLEQQACLSSKQLTVRCEGPCPCPTEQASTSTTDDKPGKTELWAPARMGWGGPPCQGSGLAREFAEQRGRRGKNRDWAGVGAGKHRPGGLGPQSQGAVLRAFSARE